jgi:hypothetical protein
MSRPGPRGAGAIERLDVWNVVAAGSSTRIVSRHKLTE